MKHAYPSTALAVSVLIAALGAPPAHADHQPEWIEIDDASIIIEVNATDDDSGIQIFLDAEGWERMSVYSPSWRRVLSVRGQGSVGTTGITELFLESAEPGFDELPLDEFLERFPEGTYTFLGRTIEGDRLFGFAELTHALPDGPELLTPEEDSVQSRFSTVVSWEEVDDPPGSSIVGYQVIVEQEEPVLRVLDMLLPPTETSVGIPAEFLQPGVEYKYEVLAIEESGNQTLSESTFEIEE